MSKKNCVLCGREVGLLDRASLTVLQTRQTFCAGCSRRYNSASPTERQALDQEILASPYLSRSDSIWADTAAGADKPCPACGTPLVRKVKNFPLGTDGTGSLAALLTGHYYVDLFACPQCGKVELYTAGYGPEAEAPAAPEEATVTCPVCGTQHSSLINCPTCVLRRGRSGGAPQAGPRPRKKKDPKPPWEK